MLVGFSSAGGKLRIYDIWFFKSCSWSENKAGWGSSVQTKRDIQTTLLGVAMWYASEYAESFSKVEMVSVDKVTVLLSITI